MSNETNCPFKRGQSEAIKEYRERVEEWVKKIEEDMRSLRLKPESVRSQVMNAAQACVRRDMACEEAAVSPLVYTTYSREGNPKTVTHPAHQTANVAVTTAAAALKMCGIYASTDKVKAATSTMEEDDYSTGPNFDD